MANQIQFSAISNTGRIRDNNEDNLYINSQYMQHGAQGNFQLSKTTEANSFVCAVCDGMGGEKSGERASLEAVSKLHYAVSTTAFPDMTLLEKIQEINKYVGETNAAIYNMAAGSFDFKGMGTTFVCLVIAQNQAAAMNVGDSRVYLFRDGILKQLTRDHSESERLIRLGIITREQARGHKSRFMLNRHLGMPPEEGILEADISEIIQLQKGDTFLLCSDGLTDMVQDEVIKDILAASIDTKESAQMLINEALKNGGKDNVTAVVLKFDNLNVIGSPSGFPIHSLHKVSRKELSLIVALIAAIVVIIILAVAFFENSLRSNTNESKDGFVSENTIGASGGTITIEGSSGISGITFEVPAGSFENDVSFNIRLENTDALQLPVEMNPIIPLITVEGVTSYSNKPISITVPVTTDQGSTIMAGYYNKETNTVTPITVLESAENQIELLVSHFSSILVFKISDDYISSVNEADSGFRPGVDDWQFKNQGSFLIPDGACGAQSITAQTYFLEKKTTSQQSLYGKYDNLSYITPDFWEDDCNPYRFVAIVQSKITNMMPQFMDEIAKNNNIGYILRSDSTVFKSIKYYLDAYHQPLLLYMVSGKDTHLCIAYRYQGDTIYISDPNYPGEERSVEFNRKIGEFGSFEDYQSGTRTASQFLLVDAKYFISRSVENKYWDELDSGTVSPNGFPDAIVQYRMEDGTFHDLTDNSSISIAQRTTLFVRGSTALPDGKALYFKLYNLKDGQTPILLQDLSDRVDYKISDAGIYGLSIWVDMKGNGNKSDCEWLDFSWFSINTGSPQISEVPDITEPSVTSPAKGEIHTLEGTFQGSEWGDFCHINILGDDGVDYSFFCLNMGSSVDWENLDIGHKVIVTWQNIDKELTIGNTTVMQNIDEILSLELNDNTQPTEQTESSDMIIDTSRFLPFEELAQPGLETTYDENSYHTSTSGDYDLDGNGVTEHISFVYGEEENPSIIQINEVSTSINVSGYEIDNVFLIDLDKNDRYMEIAVLSDTGSNDYQYNLFRFDGANVIEFVIYTYYAYGNGEGIVLSENIEPLFAPQIVLSWYEVVQNSLEEHKVDKNMWIGKEYEFTRDDNYTFFTESNSFPDSSEPLNSNWENQEAFSKGTKFTLLDIDPNNYWFLVTLEDGRTGILSFYLDD